MLNTLIIHVEESITPHIINRVSTLEDRVSERGTRGNLLVSGDFKISWLPVFCSVFIFYCCFYIFIMFEPNCLLLLVVYGSAYGRRS